MYMYSIHVSIMVIIVRLISLQNFYQIKINDAVICCDHAYVTVPLSSVVSLSMTVSGSSFFEAVLRLRRPNKDRFFPPPTGDDSSFSSSIEQYNDLIQFANQMKTCRTYMYMYTHKYWK